MFILCKIRVKHWDTEKKNKILDSNYKTKGHLLTTFLLFVVVCGAVSYYKLSVKSECLPPVKSDI